MITTDLPKIRHTGKQDFLASIVVFFVALPLCMGVALASGASVSAGLITGMVGGIVAGSLAGCQLQVSGPAAGLTVIVYEVIQRFGVEMLGVIVLMAGALQLAAGAFRLGPWFRAVSPSVIHGMLAGIGVLIFASQFHVMVDDKPRGSGLDNLATIPEALYKGLGVPHIPSEPERQFRAAALRAAGNLHEDQTNLRTHISDLIPYHHVADDAPALKDVVDPQLTEYADDQQAISRRLDELNQRLLSLESESHGAVDLDHARAALAKALQRSGEAEAALRSSKAVDAVRTQDATVAALADALSCLKSHRLAAGIGLLTIIIIVLWQKLAPVKLRLVPAPLLGIVVATALAASFMLPVLYVEIPGSLLDAINTPTMDLLRTAPWTELLSAALLIAMVASAETLLCATAVDQLSPHSPRTNYDRELTAQGVGNLICGFLGALPMTGVIVRSSANIQAGARTRLSAVLHGIWLLVFVVLLSDMLQLIPTSSLAAVLVYTGYKLVNFKHIQKLREAGWGEVLIYAATVGTIVVEDLLTGVLVGIALAAGKLLYTFSHLVIRVEHDGRRYVMHLAGSATFIRLPKLAAALEEIPSNSELHVELDRLTYIDHACLELFTSWAQQHEGAGGRLIIDWDSLHASFREGPEPLATRNGDHALANEHEPALSR
jgi:MFS superfamily sulfate permease-like transporter